MTQERKPVEQVAAEEISADEERSRGWNSPKLPGGDRGYAEVGSGWRDGWPRGQGWACGCLLVLVVLVIGVGGYVFFLAPGDSPASSPSAPPATAASSSASPGDTPAVSASPSPQPTRTPTTPPTASATATATASGSRLDGPASFQKLDDTGDAITDSGAAAPEDAVVDITDVLVSRSPDGSTSLLISNAAPMGPDDLSRAINAVFGRTIGAADDGVVLADAQFQPIRTWFWQLHDGVLTSGALDGEAGLPIETQAVIEHRLSVGIFTFDIPAAEIPEDAEWVWIFSFHTASPDTERTRDDLGPIDLSGVPAS